MTSNFSVGFLISMFINCLMIPSTSADNFNQYFDITWGDGRGKILDDGKILTLSLDKASGSGFQSKKEYLFAKIHMQIKLVPGNSAGTVTTYYLSSDESGSAWDEIDLEFLGNLSGDPYILHTNVYSHGKGDREEQFYLWFDPTADFHTYSILWNPQTIILSVDDTPIRQFKNLESKGIPFPNKQKMRIKSTIWDGEDWATRGGLVKTDWSKAPFTATYTNFKEADPNIGWLSEQMDPGSRNKLKWARSHYMIYDYCSDKNRFPQGSPPECAYNNP